MRIIEPLENTGFAGGCNLGIRAHGPFDLVALVNNDAVVDRGWLRPLVDAIGADPRVGAASPKMLFDGRFVEVEVDVPAAAPVAARRAPARRQVQRVPRRRRPRRRLITFDEGFFPPEEPRREHGEEVARWSWRHGHIRVRVDRDTAPTKLAMRVEAPVTRQVCVRSAAATVRFVATTSAAWHDIELGGPPFNVINNAGSALYPHGFGGDRGFLERDHGQYDDPAEVFAWCGGAVLLRRSYLDDVGLFDDRLFLYYEDTDLSWRGQLNGWTYRFVPGSVVHHRHAQSVGEGSPVFRYQTERNRPLVLAKNAPAGLAVRAAAGLLRAVAAVTVKGVLLRPFTLRMPLLGEAGHHWKVLGGYLHLLPAMIGDRRRARPVVARRSVLRWEQTKEIAR